MSTFIYGVLELLVRFVVGQFLVEEWDNWKSTCQLIQKGQAKNNGLIKSYTAKHTIDAPIRNRSQSEIICQLISIGLCIAILTAQLRQKHF
ncbi:hypothetical protein AB205_0040420 [Aquarana catesbeiana]|uniref:Uncharacterized protein n=1 Tax=Aquarana catesbeiana TaxID=8400 RepID=A0A2G9RJZ9_AQUCT|nr:hypothetical protein AB205_0040420 [Aquarana catesbeiana]